MEHGADLPAVIAPGTDARLKDLPPEVVSLLECYRTGAISAEVALMRLLLTCGATGPLFDCLGRIAGSPEYAALRRLASDTRRHLERTATLVASGLAAERNTMEAIREQFDLAVALSPEASVALYSLGAPATLDRATTEVVTRLRKWGLLCPDCTVLDIGCGIGRFEAALAAEVGAITGIDLSTEMIAEARRRCTGLANVALRQCSGTELSDFAEKSFDLVLAVDTFPYLAAVDDALAAQHVAEAARLLRPGGALVILNYSYRGKLDSDRAEVARLAALHEFVLERSGTRDFALWDGATFLLRKAGEISARLHRG